MIHWRERSTQIFLGQVLLAFVLTGVGGLLLEKNGFTLPDHPLPIALALLIGGILFIGVEAWLRGRTAQKEITWRIAVMVGLGQLIAAVFPGASRSGTTILIALLMGLSRSRATEFSFLVGIPTMLAAGGYKIWKALKAPLNEGVMKIGRWWHGVLRFPGSSPSWPSNGFWVTCSLTASAPSVFIGLR